MLLLVIVVGAHAAMFLVISARPVYWLHNELIAHRFTWARDGLAELSLHSGLRVSDFWKLLWPTQVEGWEQTLERDDAGGIVARTPVGVFRARQFSYLVEMLSFKLERLLLPASVKTVAPLVLHLANVVLLARLLQRLGTCGWAATAGALLLLNAGVALHTVTFPFRNAKVLVVTLFLLGGTLLIGPETERVHAGRVRSLAFAAVFLLALFTDEMAWFLFTIYAAYAWLTRSRAADRRRALLASVVAALAAFGVLTSLFVSFSADPSISVGHFRHATEEVFRQLTEEPVVRENTRAFLTVFLPSTFGQWDMTAPGIAAALAMGVLAAASLFAARPPRQHWGLAVVVSIAFGAMAILLPHNSGLHPAAMPPGARVPTLLYFDYYYAYPFSVLAIIALVLLLGRGLAQPPLGIVGVALTAVVAVSNVTEAIEGPQMALRVDEWNPERAAAVRRILAVDGFARGPNRDGPIYLSFPSGDPTLVNCGLDTPRRPVPRLYACLVPELYLGDLERGRLRMSLRNVRRPGRENSTSELMGSRTFYDVPSGRWLDLSKMRPVLPSALRAVGPIAPEGETWHWTGRGAERLMLFVLGRAALEVHGTKAVAVGRQSYGHSYQLFDVALDAITGPEASVSTRVVPEPDAGPVFVVAAER